MTKFFTFAWMSLFTAAAVAMPSKQGRITKDQYQMFFMDNSDVGSGAYVSDTSSVKSPKTDDCDSPVLPRYEKEIRSSFQDNFSALGAMAQASRMSIRTNALGLWQAACQN